MTAMVSVAAAPVAEGWECAVEVAAGAGRTSHAVTVRSRDVERWGRPGETPEQLVVRAFEFLLAREPAGSILRRFEVSDISRYFPEFDREMRA
jgi:hypothetical protein